MLKVGLTGGYASGKSLIARHLELLGCFVIYADNLGHQALSPQGEAYDSVVSLFGPGIQDQDGTINRQKLAAIVFNDAASLDQLNAIVHPAVLRLEDQTLLHFASGNPQGIAVIEAAILIESGHYKRLDKLIVVSCRLALQVERAMERNHVTREQALQRIERQLSNDDRLRFADYVIDTNGSLDETIRQVDRLFPELRQLAEETAV